jgi:hypothetical protein
MNMENTSPAPQDAQNSAEAASTLTGLLSAEYVCPVCKATVIKIQGNELQYLESHVKHEGNADGQVSLLLYHKSKGVEFVPARALEHPFLVIKSSIITPA